MNKEREGREFWNYYVPRNIRSPCMTTLWTASSSSRHLASVGRPERMHTAVAQAMATHVQGILTTDLYAGDGSLLELGGSNRISNRWDWIKLGLPFPTATKIPWRTVLERLESTLDCRAWSSLEIELQMLKDIR